MIWQPLLLAFALPAFSGSGSTTTPLNVFALRAMSVGIPNRVPAPIAALIDVAPDAPVHLLRVPPDQTSDGIAHRFQVVVELSSSTPRRPIRPVALVFAARQVLAGKAEDYFFRADLNGAIEKAVVIVAKTDDSGKSIKGSGEVTKLDPDDPAVRKRFQHELDLWLKRRYLKKEWRSAEFSGGVLKKKGKTP